MPHKSNDQLPNLKPVTEFDSPKLTFDFPGFLIGAAEYAEGPTGCTVFRFPGGAATAIDVRGGMVGLTQEYTYCSAICLAGGSLLGLEAATGVAGGIYAERGYSFSKGMPIVNGAIIYDFGARNNSIYPDKALGRAALEAAQAGVFPLGARGAGRSAGVGGVFKHENAEPSGQGGAFRQIDEVKIAVFTVVNALGVVLNRQGEVVRGNLNRKTGQRVHPLASAEENIRSGQSTESPVGNTTLSVLVTNQKLENDALTQIGRQVHSSMARAIYPFHTMMDGDIFYTVSTNKVKSKISPAALGMLASELAWDAVLSAVGQP